MGDLEKEVKEILKVSKDPESIEQTLIQKGYLKDDIELALHSAEGDLYSGEKGRRQQVAKKFFIKEIFDRIGYGFGSEQYINILFLQSGAPYSVIAIVNGLKAVIGSFLSSFIRDFSQDKTTAKHLLSYSGIAFGLSFVLMAFAAFISSVALFVAALLIGVIGVVAYGEFYQHTMRVALKDEKRGQIEGIYRYGLIITVVSLVIGAAIMDRFDVLKISLNLFGMDVSIRLFGYFIVFEIAAIFFIMAGIILLRLDGPHPRMGIGELVRHIPNYFANLKQDVITLSKNRHVMLLVVAGSLTGMVQILGNSFYGIFVYDHFKNFGFGGFLNVAMISILALVVSLLTPLITKENARVYGKYPMLIFGTALMSIMPLAFYYNPNLVSLGMGTILGVTGAAIVGIANGMLSSELMPRDVRGDAFAAYTVLTIIPYLITIPIGAYAVHTLGIATMLFYLALILLILVVPIYFIMMLMPNIGRQENHGEAN